MSWRQRSLSPSENIKTARIIYKKDKRFDSSRQRAKAGTNAAAFEEPLTWLNGETGQETALIEGQLPLPFDNRWRWMEHLPGFPGFVGVSKPSNLVTCFAFAGKQLGFQDICISLPNR